MDMPKTFLGRHVYGLAALAFALITLVWHDFNTWQQIRPLGTVSHREMLIYLAVALELLGGIAIQFPKTARAGAFVLGALYFIFAVLWVPFIVATPLVYDRRGNFFEQFSIVSGALIVFAMAAKPAPGLARLGYIFFSFCVVSFTLEQAFYLQGTASSVPNWIPPGQMFWAILTTLAFALAAMALFSGRFALLASRLLTVMLLGFQLLVWLPALFQDPHKLINWAGNAQNLAITASAWIVADFLARNDSLEDEKMWGRASPACPAATRSLPKSLIKRPLFLSTT